MRLTRRARQVCRHLCSRSALLPHSLTGSQRIHDHAVLSDQNDTPSTA
jgi:hypothetical protein